MVHLETGFRPKLLERNIIRQTKNDVRQRLQGYDLGALRIVLKRGRAGKFAFQFFGDSNSVEKAKGLLGIY